MPLLAIVSAIIYLAFGAFRISLGPPQRATSFDVPVHYFLGQPLWHFRSYFHREERSTLRVDLRTDGRTAFPIHGLQLGDHSGSFEIWLAVEHSLSGYQDALLRMLAQEQISPETVRAQSATSPNGLLAVSLEGKAVANEELYVLYVGQPLLSDFLTAILCPSRRSPVIVCQMRLYSAAGYSMTVSFPPEKLPLWEGIARAAGSRLEIWRIKER